MKATPRVPDDAPNLPDMHPGRELLWLLAAFGGLVGICLAIAAFFVEVVVWVLPYDLEPLLLEGLRPPQEFSAEESEAEERLQTLVDDLAAHWPENPYRLRVRIIDSAPNAFAVPGGEIWIAHELIARAESENEVALVLGHEIGHFRNRDHLRGLGRGVLFSLVVGALGGQWLAGTSTSLVELGFSREQEREADAFGLGLVEAHYGHVGASFGFFEWLAEVEKSRSSVPGFASTHPGSSDRVETLRALARERGYALDGALAPAIPLAN